MDNKGKGVYQGEEGQDESSCTSNIGSSQEKLDLNIAPPNEINHIQQFSRTHNNNNNYYYNQQGHFMASILPLHHDHNNTTARGFGIGHEPYINRNAPQLLGQPFTLPNGACKFSSTPSNGASSSRTPLIDGILVGASSENQGNNGFSSGDDALDLGLRLGGSDPNQQGAQSLNENSQITLSSGYSNYVLEESQLGEGRSSKEKRVSCKRKLSETGCLSLGDSSRENYQSVTTKQQPILTPYSAPSIGVQVDTDIPQGIMNRTAMDSSTPLSLNQLFNLNSSHGMRHNVAPIPSMARTLPGRTTYGVQTSLSSSAFVSTNRLVNGPSHGINYFSSGGNFLPPNSHMGASNANRTFQRLEFEPSSVSASSREMERSLRGVTLREVQARVAAREAREERRHIARREGNLQVGSDPLEIDHIRAILLRNALGLLRRNGSLARHEVGWLNGRSRLHVLPEEPDQYENMRLDVDSMSYEELLELEQKIGDVSTGLSENVIAEKMKRETFACNKVIDDPCPICQDEYADGDEIGKLECGHNFHFECVKQWLRRKNSCPICKKKALDDN